MWSLAVSSPSILVFVELILSQLFGCLLGVIEPRLETLSCSNCVLR